MTTSALPEWKWDVDRDKKLLARIKELLAKPDFEKAETNPYLRYRKALAQAAKEIPAKVKSPIEGNQKPIPKPLSREEKDARDKKLLARADELLKTDPGLREMSQRDDYGAFKTALRRAATETPLSVQARIAAKNQAALDRARRVHKGAMILLTTDPDLVARAEKGEKDYAEAFEAAHRAADGNMLLNIEPPMEATSFQLGSREATIHAKALRLLIGYHLRARDKYDAGGAFDEAIAKAAISLGSTSAGSGKLPLA